jgi:Caspase domain/WD domain, G-beta repeat
MGTWDYTHLQSVPAAGNSLRRMAELLTSPLCGWPQDRLLTLANEPSQGDLSDQLITAFDGTTDVALFYYVGHGQLAPDDHLCLGLVQSREEPNRRAATSLRFSDVRHALQECDAATKIVILDCCFAGLATSSPVLGGPTANVLDLTAGTGAYTMAATRAYNTAWYERDPTVTEPQTYFTKYLADLVKEGIPGQPPVLRLDPLFRQLHDNLAADRRPIPVRRGVNDAPDFVFAYNNAPVETHRHPEQEVITLSERLAETDARLQALTAEAAERTRELERLRRLAAAPTDPEQDRRLQEAIRQAVREINGIRATVAASTSPSVKAPVAQPSLRRAGKRLGRVLLGTILALAVGGAVGIAFALLQPGPTGSKQPPGAATPADSPATHRTSSPATQSASQAAHTQSPAAPPATTPATSGPITGPITGTFAKTLNNPLYNPYSDSVSFGQTAQQLAVGSGTRAYVWDPATKTITATLPDPKSKGINTVVFGWAGTVLVTGDDNGTTYLWDPATKKIITTFPDPNSDGVYSVAFSPGGATLAVGDGNGTTYLWDIATRRVIETFPDPDSFGVNWVAFGPNGTTLAVADGNGSTYFWDIASEKNVQTLPDPHHEPVYAIAFGPGGTTLAAGGINGVSYVWDISAAKIIATLPDPNTNGGVYSVEFGPGGTSLAAGDGNGTTYLWNIATQSITAQLTDPNSRGVNGVAFAPGAGTTLAVGDDNGRTYLWHISSDKA